MRSISFWPKLHDRHQNERSENGETLQAFHPAPQLHGCSSRPLQRNFRCIQRALCVITFLKELRLASLGSDKVYFGRGDYFHTVCHNVPSQNNRLFSLLTPGVPGSAAARGVGSAVNTAAPHDVSGAEDVLGKQREG